MVMILSFYDTKKVVKICYITKIKKLCHFYKKKMRIRHLILKEIKFW
jgi:hypothetical protein